MERVSLFDLLDVYLLTFEVLVELGLAMPFVVAGDVRRLVERV